MVEFGRYRRKRNKNNGLSMTPLIDMVFLLLIFFLLTSYYTKPKIPVNLSEAENAGIHQDTRIVVVVQKDGTIILENDTMTEDKLPGVLRTMLESGTDKKVNIQADRSVRFGTIVRLMDLIYLSGAKDIYFEVEKGGNE